MKFIDLSRPIYGGMPKYPSDSDASVTYIPARKEMLVLDLIGVEQYKSGRTELQIGSHHGTHIDAPSHKLPRALNISDYNLDRFENEVILIDLRDKSLYGKSRRMISANDIPDFNYNRDIGAVILYTGFCDLLNESIGSHQKAELERGFPYLSIEAIQKIYSISHSKLSVIGIDSFAVDQQGSNSEVHREMFRKDILPLENLYNLRELANAFNYAYTSATLCCAPISIRGGDAAPTRAYVRIE